MRACMLSHFSRVQLSVTPWTMAHQAPLSMGLSRQEHWNGLPFPSSAIKYEVSEGSEVKSLSCVRLFATPWTVARQAPLSITSSRSLLKFMSIELVMASHHLILCHPLLLPPSIFPSIRVFSKESVLHTTWPNHGVSASASVLQMNIQD